jgi:hypothetical protein
MMKDAKAFIVMLVLTTFVLSKMAKKRITEA